jgi:hypothetical protein
MENTEREVAGDHIRTTTATSTALKLDGRSELLTELEFGRIRPLNLLRCRQPAAAREVTTRSFAALMERMVLERPADLAERARALTRVTRAPDDLETVGTREHQASRAGGMREEGALAEVAAQDRPP